MAAAINLSHYLLQASSILHLYLRQFAVVVAMILTWLPFFTDTACVRQGHLDYEKAASIVGYP